MNAEAHEAWRKWCEHAVENKWQDLSQGADALAACYLDAMTRLDKAEKVCEAFHRCRVISRVTKDGRTVAAIEDQARVQELYEAYTDYRAFLAAERK